MKLTEASLQALNNRLEKLERKFDMYNPYRTMYPIEGNLHEQLNASVRLLYVHGLIDEDTRDNLIRKLYDNLARTNQYPIGGVPTDA